MAALTHIKVAAFVQNTWQVIQKLESSEKSF